MTNYLERWWFIATGIYYLNVFEGQEYGSDLVRWFSDSKYLMRFQARCWQELQSSEGSAGTEEDSIDGSTRVFPWLLARVLTSSPPGPLHSDCHDMKANIFQGE